MKLKSALFNLCFHTYMFCFYVLCYPVLYFLPKPWIYKGMQGCGYGVTIILRLFGVKSEIRGRKYKLSTPCIYAAKHQSEWDTQVMGFEIPMPVFIVKVELFKKPFFGWLLKHLGMIGVDRSGKKRGVMRQMLDQAIPYIKQGRTLVIYPEGTRREPGAEPDYKSGIAMLYKHANVPVVPIALNSGLFWRKNKLTRTGTAILEYLPPIEPGLDSKEFMQRLEHDIETATARLIEEQSIGASA
jgi:1-acyl-sn-glycerol-3-phosphate acyltransferase